MKSPIAVLLFTIPLLAGADTITVNGPPLEYPIDVRGAVELEFDTQLGEYYQIEISPDMVLWDPAGYTIMGTGGMVSTVVSTRDWPKAFFRVSDGANPSNMLPVYSAAAPIVIDSNNTIGLNPATDRSILRSNGANWVSEQIPAVALDNMQPWIGMNFIIALQGLYPSRSSDEPFIGQVILFGGNFAPRSWALCDGQLLPISQYTALFSILGTTYGGDGRTSFALPDLRGRVPIHPGTGAGLTNRRLGAKGGAETTTHSH